MPNWCSNNLKIEGSPAEIIQIAEQLAAPYQREVYDLRTQKTQIETVQVDLSLMNMRKPWNSPEGEVSYNQGENWYHANIAAWGTKWDVDGALNKSASTPTMLVYDFDSAWSPPIPAIEALVAQWPSLTFTHTYDESGNDFAGRCVYSEGQLVDSEEGESRNFYCPTCQEHTYCEWGEELACGYTQKDYPNLPAFRHAIADPGGDLDTIMWALTGTLEGMEAGTEAIYEWEVEEVARAIADSPTVGHAAERQAFMKRVVDTTGTIPDWLAGALLTGLSADEVDALAHGQDKALAGLVSQGVAHRLSSNSP